MADVAFYVLQWSTTMRRPTTILLWSFGRSPTTWVVTLSGGIRPCDHLRCSGPIRGRSGMWCTRRVPVYHSVLHRIFPRALTNRSSLQFGKTGGAYTLLVLTRVTTRVGFLGLALVPIEDNGCILHHTSCLYDRFGTRYLSVYSPFHDFLPYVWGEAK